MHELLLDFGYRRLEIRRYFQCSDVKDQQSEPWGPQAEEFQVHLSAFDAKYDGAGNGQIRIVVWTDWNYPGLV